MNKAIEYIIRAKDATGAGIKSAMGRIKSLAAGIGRNLTNIQSGLSMAMGAVQKFASVFAKAIGEAFKFEKAQSDFKVLLGSADQAKEHLADLRSFAASTPLSFEDLTKASKLLLSFGASVDEVMPSMKMLGDIAMGDAQKFQGLALVFAQVKSAGKLMGQDLLQMINQGFNPLTIIAKETGKSMSELKDMMGEGQISFEMVAEAMRIATSEGGLFNAAMAESAKTGEGMVSTLKDNWTEAVRIFGEAFSDVAKDGIGTLSDKIQQLTEDGSIELWIEKIIDAFARVKEGAQTVLGPLAKVFTFGWKAIKGGYESMAQGGGNFVGTLIGGGGLGEAIGAGFKGYKQGWVDAFDLDGAQAEYDAQLKRTDKERRRRKAAQASGNTSAAPAKSLAEMMASAEAGEKAKAEEAARKAAEKAAAAEEKERLKLEKAIAAERERLRKAEMKAYERELTKAHQTAQDKSAAAQERLAAAQSRVAQAWGWYRDKDSLSAQLEEERADAKAHAQFEKDFERLRSRSDWRTAAAYGSGKMRALTLDEEATRRVALAREEERAAEAYAKQTAEECTRAANALEALQNTICGEG